MTYKAKYVIRATHYTHRYRRYRTTLSAFNYMVFFYNFVNDLYNKLYNQKCMMIGIVVIFQHIVDFKKKKNQTNLLLPFAKC